MAEAVAERLVPSEQLGTLVLAEHYARYRFAAQLAAGRRVLDAACGEGYGTAMLAQAGAQSITGIDLDATTVETAIDRYGLSFLAGDVRRLPFPDRSFDLIVSFETIEHLREGEQVIAEFARVLDEDGLLVISSPNSSEYKTVNEHHLREYTTEEFRELLSAHFDQVQLFYQQNWLLSAILAEAEFGLDDGGTPLALEVTKTAGSGPGQELYTIAVCGSRLPDSLAQKSVASAIYEAHRLMEWHDRAQEIRRDFELVKERHDAWLERAQEAERLLIQRDRELDKLSRDYAIKAADVAEAEHYWQIMESMANSLSWRITRPLRQAKARAQRYKELQERVRRKFSGRG